MEGKRAKPMARGVTELMYVGDSEDYGGEQGAASSLSIPIAGVLAAVALVGGSSLTRLAAGAGAAYIAYKNKFWLSRRTRGVLTN